MPGATEQTTTPHKNKRRIFRGALYMVSRSPYLSRALDNQTYTEMFS